MSGNYSPCARFKTQNSRGIRASAEFRVVNLTIMKTYRIAVLGPHRRGRIGLLAHQPDRGFRVTTVCGQSNDQLDGFYKKCGSDLRFTDDFREVAESDEIDVVLICTPDFLHTEHSIACLEAGKYVFLEKPLAINIPDCDRILETAERHGGKLYVGHNMRFFPVIRKMKELIDAGRIGQVEAIWCRHFVGDGGDYYFKNYNSQKEYTTSLLLQKGAHDIDIIHWLAGAYTERVTGMGKLSVYNRVTDRRSEDLSAPRGERDPSIWPPLSQKGLNPTIDIEDHNMILMQLTNGAQASYMECFYTPDYHRNYTIIGTEGRIENHGDHSTDANWAKVHLWNRRSGYSTQGHEIFPIPPITGTHGGADPLLIDDFLRFVETGKIEGASPLAGRMAVAVGCQGAESIRSRSEPMDVPPARS